MNEFAFITGKDISPNIELILARIRFRESIIIRLHIFESWTIQKIANIFSLTRERIDQILNQGLMRMSIKYNFIIKARHRGDDPKNIIKNEYSLLDSTTIKRHNRSRWEYSYWDSSAQFLYY
jgi:hypothetical protein